MKPMLSAVLVVLTVPMTTFGATMSVTVNGAAGRDGLARPDLGGGPAPERPRDRRWSALKPAFTTWATPASSPSSVRRHRMPAPGGQPSTPPPATCLSNADVRGRLNPTSRDLGCIAMSPEWLRARLVSVDRGERQSAGRLFGDRR